MFAVSIKALHGPLLYRSGTSERTRGIVLALVLSVLMCVLKCHQPRSTALTSLVTGLDSTRPAALSRRRDSAAPLPHVIATPVVVVVSKPSFAFSDFEQQRSKQSRWPRRRLRALARMHPKMANPKARTLNMTLVHQSASH